MIGCPILFNMMQFWLIDNIIKRKENVPSENDRSLYEESCVVDNDIEWKKEGSSSKIMKEFGS